MRKSRYFKSTLLRRRAHDDELLEKAQQKLEDVTKRTEAHGLELHPNTTTILRSQKANRLRKTEIGEMQVEILLLGGKIKYLGQMLSFVDQDTTEVQHRIRCAWSAFTKHQQETTFQSYRLQHRQHMFDAVVTPTVSYGAGTWATAKEHEKMLRTTQRRMLRLVVQTKRKYNKTTRRKLEEKTFVTTKSARRLKMKSAHMMNATKTAAFHSTTMKKTQQAIKTILKTRLNT